MIEFILAPILCAVVLSLLTGPLGCFVVWRKMAYFGDTVAHASLLGVSIGILFEVSQSIAVLATCLCLSFALSYLKAKNLSNDTSLGIFAHGSLALGLLIVTLISHKRVSIQAILMGDILTVNYFDLWILLGSAIAVLCVLCLFWKKLLLSTIDKDLASVEGHPIRQSQLILSLLITVTISFGVNLVGVLLVSAMLIIPAASARSLTSSPEAMALVAAAIGAACSVIGIVVSAYSNTPAGPAIVSTSLAIFICSIMMPKRWVRF